MASVKGSINKITGSIPMGIGIAIGTAIVAYVVTRFIPGVSGYVR